MVGFMEKVSLIPIIGILCISLVIPPLDITEAQTDLSLLPAAPNVMYMNEEAVDAYKANMMNYSRLGADVGNVSDIETALYGNSTYVALIATNSTERNNVYIQISREHSPTNFSNPINLTNPAVNVNASHLGIAAFNSTYVYVIWQDTSPNGNSSIYTSDSKDSGQSFKTYKLSGDSNAKNPKIVTDGVNVFYTWLEQTTEGCNNATVDRGVNMTGGSFSASNRNNNNPCGLGFGHGSGW